MKHEIDLLIEDYSMRIATVNTMLSDIILSDETKKRLETKKGCYQSFRSELYKIKSK